MCGSRVVVAFDRVSFLVVVDSTFPHEAGVIQRQPEIAWPYDCHWKVDVGSCSDQVN
jgi:hypothetical protein